MEEVDTSHAAFFLSATISWETPEFEGVIRILQFIADGWSPEDLLETMSDDESISRLSQQDEIAFALSAAQRVEEGCPELASLIRAFISLQVHGAEESYTQPHPDQLSLFD